MRSAPLGAPWLWRARLGEHAFRYPPVCSPPQASVLCRQAGACVAVARREWALGIRQRWMVSGLRLLVRRGSGVPGSANAPLSAIRSSVHRRRHPCCAGRRAHALRWHVESGHWASDRDGWYRVCASWCVVALACLARQTRRFPLSARLFTAAGIHACCVGRRAGACVVVSRSHLRIGHQAKRAGPESGAAPWLLRACSPRRR